MAGPTIADSRASGRRGGDGPSSSLVEIGPTVDWRSELSALWAYRELLYFLAWRDVKVRYKETLLGVAWAVLQPLATAVMFTLIFSRLAGLRSDGVPYPLWSYAGLVPWMYAANAVTQGAGSLVGNAALVTKVYFPRLIVPLASCLSGMLDLGVALVILAPLMAWYGIVPGPSLLVLPAVLVLAVVVAASVGLWLAALTARYRDVRYVVPFVMQLWLLATPVVYPSSALREPWRTLSGVNPMAGVVEGIRWALFAVPPPTLLPVLSVVATLAVLVSGLLYFRGVEGELADVV